MRRAPRSGPSYCKLPNCRTKVTASGHLMCARHWALVPAPTRAEVREALATFRSQGHFGNAAAKYLDAVRAAIDSVMMREKEAEVRQTQGELSL